MKKELLKELLTTKQVAQLLQVKPLTIYRKVKAKDLKAYSIGRHLRFKIEDIEIFLKKHRI
jgi:excisionase family DNA binding protein